MELADLLFGALWSSVLIGLFELLHDMYSVGVIKHPLWSSMYPKVWKLPVPHHIYLFHLMVLILWIYIRV